MKCPKLALGLLGLCLIASSAVAIEVQSAQPSSNIYFAYSAGPQARAKATDSAGATTFKTGFALNGAIGVRLNQHRIEGECSYFNNECKATDPAGTAIAKEKSSGSVDVDALMLNYYYDFSIGDGRFQPFISAGAGMYRVSINGLTTPSLRTLPAEWGGPVIVYAKSTWTPGYQVRLGVKFKLTKRADLFAAYRRLIGSDMDINLSDGSTIHPDAKLQGLEAGLHLNF